MSDNTALLTKQTKKDLTAHAEELGMAVPTGWGKADLVEHIENHVESEADDAELQEMHQDYITALEESATETKAAKSTAGKIRPIPTRGAGLIICTAIQEYVGNDEAIDEDEIIASVKNAYPNQNPDSKAIAYYKTLLRNNGEAIPKGKAGRKMTPAPVEEDQPQAAE